MRRRRSRKRNRKRSRRKRNRERSSKRSRRRMILTWAMMMMTSLISDERSLVSLVWRMISCDVIF